MSSEENEEFRSVSNFGGRAYLGEETILLEIDHLFLSVRLNTRRTHRTHAQQYSDRRDVFKVERTLLLGCSLHHEE